MKGVNIALRHTFTAYPGAHIILCICYTFFITLSRRCEKLCFPSITVLLNTLRISDKMASRMSTKRLAVRETETQKHRLVTDRLMTAGLDIKSEG